MDWPLGEDRKRESSNHFRSIDFLLHLADSPLQNAELINPIKPEVEFNGTGSNEEEMIEPGDEFDPSQWQTGSQSGASDSLSTWSELTDSDDDDASRINESSIRNDSSMTHQLNLPKNPKVVKNKQTFSDNPWDQWKGMTH